ncbi:MAG: tetratricopeptide repeat protein [Acidobacteriota bacterium]|nr:tetratricopeptide repeat protein [Acidobacteriota bacterium]
MRSAESLTYRLAVPWLRTAVILLASVMAPVMAPAQAPPADPRGAQLGTAAQHLQQGKTEQAIRECKSVLAADPRSAPAHMLLGMAYLAKGSMVAQAKAELQQSLDLDPDLLWARFYLARLYLDQGLTEKAQEQLERGLKQSPGLPAFLSLLGEVRRKLGDPGASLELNRKALEADPTMIPAHYLLALAYLDLKQEQAAIAEFEKVIHSPYVTPEMYNALASLYIRKQQFAEAEDLCRKAIALDRSQPDAYLNLARVYNARHESDKALEALNAALPEGKEFSVSEYYQTLQADIAVERGVAYAASKMFARAIEEYVSALDFDPSRAAVHRRLAELYLQQGDPARAALHTREAEKLEKGQK